MFRKLIIAMVVSLNLNQEAVQAQVLPKTDKILQDLSLEEIKGLSLRQSQNYDGYPNPYAKPPIMRALSINGPDVKKGYRQAALTLVNEQTSGVIVVPNGSQMGARKVRCKGMKNGNVIVAAVAVVALVGMAVLRVYLRGRGPITREISSLLFGGSVLAGLISFEKKLTGNRAFEAVYEPFCSK